MGKPCCNLQRERLERIRCQGSHPITKFVLQCLALVTVCSLPERTGVCRPPVRRGACLLACLLLASAAAAQPLDVLQPLLLSLTGTTLMQTSTPPVGQASGVRPWPCPLPVTP